MTKPVVILKVLGTPLQSRCPRHPRCRTGNGIRALPVCGSMGRARGAREAMTLGFLLSFLISRSLLNRSLRTGVAGRRRRPGLPAFAPPLPVDASPATVPEAHSMPMPKVRVGWLTRKEKPANLVKSLKPVWHIAHSECLFCCDRVIDAFLPGSKDGREHLPAVGRWVRMFPRQRFGGEHGQIAKQIFGQSFPLGLRPRQQRFDAGEHRFPLLGLG